MGVVSFEKNRLRERKIEVEAFVALYLNTETVTIKRKCEATLYGIAFPESLAEKINQKQLELQ